MVDQMDAPTTPPPGPEPEPTPDSTEARQARWVAQLQAMIDDLATSAGPTLREVAAKAAELAAKAGDAAGPIAHKAASVTGDVGQRVAARSRDLAADLRRPLESNGHDATVETISPEDSPDATMPNPSDGEGGSPTV
jgi:hypothetical protein